MIHRQDRQTNFLRFFGNTDLRSYATFSFRNEGKSCKINIFLIAFQLSFLFNYYFFFFDFPYVLSGLMHVTAADDAPTVPFDPVSHSTLFCLRVLTRTRNIRPTAGEAFFWLTFFSSSFSSTFFFFFFFCSLRISLHKMKVPTLNWEERWWRPFPYAVRVCVCPPST